ncbi:hypothetical protein TNCT_239771 [Trichonephila clavata]|uniref:Uncharacterized protein n=1 Tax=Trichonephila clavata TaxID=2740835 RepID=A0A8X6FLK6_TRICU|nr:hypothetical protein TNCT_239771 [Trichonephila clavata]
MGFLLLICNDMQTAGVRRIGHSPCEFSVNSLPGNLCCRIAPNSEDSCLVHIFRLRQALMDSIQFCLAVITLGRPTTTY